MGDKAIILEIVTPRKVVFSGEVESFSAPGVMGSFQVLYNHAPILSEIGVGQVKLRDRTGKEAFFATSGGIVDVVKNHVTVLAETAEQVQDIDVARAEAAKERARKRLTESKEGTDVDRAKRALARALNRLGIAGKR